LQDVIEKENDLKARILGVGLVLGLVACAAVAGAQTKSEDKAPVPPAAKEISVVGEVLDMACFMGHEAKGEKHASCAKKCVAGGAPMGLLTTDGKVMLLVADHSAEKAYEDLKAKAGENVTVTGAMFERGGLAALQVKSSAAVK